MEVLKLAEKQPRLRDKEFKGRKVHLLRWIEDSLWATICQTNMSRFFTCNTELVTCNICLDKFPLSTYPGSKFPTPLGQVKFSPERMEYMRKHYEWVPDEVPVAAK